MGRLAIRADHGGGSGDPTTAPSSCTRRGAMYCVMRWKAADSYNLGSDGGPSEGHAVPILYAACADLGVMFEPTASAG